MVATVTADGERTTVVVPHPLPQANAGFFRIRLR